MGNADPKGMVSVGSGRVLALGTHRSPVLHPLHGLIAVVIKVGGV